MRILVIEDDEVLSDSLIRAMSAAGYATDHAADGERALAMLLDGSYDLAILDLNLPKMDGLMILRQVRAAKMDMPVIILTARDGINDRVLGLDLGADDYLTKPFSLAELEARVRALLRRGRSGGAATLTCGALEFDSAGRRVALAGATIELSARELAVLETLMFRLGKVVSKEQLIESLCAWSEEVTPNAIEVYVHRLRKKLESGGVEIRTVRGLGYLMCKA